MARKIIYLPLDERPCNYLFPREIFAGTDIAVAAPPAAAMGKKKTPGDFQLIREFLLNECKDAYGAVISVDTLLYGGIVPSRLHHLALEELISRLSLLSELKKRNPELALYAFQLIMRTPQESISEEEPEYYGECGREIFLQGYYRNKERLGIITDEERQAAAAVKIKPEYIDDYLNRRRVNLAMNRATLELLAAGVIDFLVIPQDDASEYGFPSMDQAELRAVIAEKRLGPSVYLYPGADEVGCVLLARMLNKVKGGTPRVFLKYPSPSAPMVIPCLEDRPLDVTAKYHIASAGGVSASSLADADIALLLLIGADKMIPRPGAAPGRGVDVLSNLPECFEFARRALADGRSVAVADLIHLNGGSPEVLSYIKRAGLTMKLAAYAGWNTASNSLGTAIAQAIVYHYYGDRPEHRFFLVKRYIEDIGYCGVVREKVASEIISRGLSYFNVGEEDGWAARRVEEELNKFFADQLPEVFREYRLEDARLPWKRMFEVDFKVKER